MRSLHLFLFKRRKEISRDIRIVDYKSAADAVDFCGSPTAVTDAVESVLDGVRCSVERGGQINVGHAQLIHFFRAVRCSRNAEFRSS